MASPSEASACPKPLRSPRSWADAAHGRSSIFASCQPTDMRKGFEGLSALVRQGKGKRQMMRLYVNAANLGKSGSCHLF